MLSVGGLGKCGKPRPNHFRTVSDTTKCRVYNFTTLSQPRHLCNSGVSLCARHTAPCSRDPPTLTPPVSADKPALPTCSCRHISKIECYLNDSPICLQKQAGSVRCSVFGDASGTRPRRRRPDHRRSDKRRGPARRLDPNERRSRGYFLTLVTVPAPTVRPPSRIAKPRPSSIAIGWMSVTAMSVVSPGITISVPAGSSMTPVTSVVRK